MEDATLNSKTVLEVLGGFARRRQPAERCDLCGISLAPGHPHLLSASDGRIVCACDPCATLFSHRDGGQKFLRIPRTARWVEGLSIEDATWTSLHLPIDL